MLEFKLEADQEFIALNNLLKVLHLVGTGGEANVRIMQGEVQVNGTTASEKRKKIRSGDTVLFKGKTIKVQ
jgi:ribosome-associated protein